MGFLHSVNQKITQQPQLFSMGIRVMTIKRRKRKGTTNHIKA